MAIIPSLPSISKHPFSSSALSPSTASVIFDSKVKSREIERTHLSLFTGFYKSPGLKLKAARKSVGLTQELKSDKMETKVGTANELDLFDEMKHRFLSFKKQKYMENFEHYQNLADTQTPKFMVIACADSRVCPSNILGFQPGEAFVIRNIANMVPPCETGPSETNAGLEFSVNTLKVENILVIGHSRCGGIRALMSMQDEVDSSFIRSWVLVGKNARLNTKAAASNLNFDHQCTHCEKESVNCSLSNLLTYPWIKEKVMKGTLSLHGGYYDFVDCTFEKWTLDYEGSHKDESDKFAVKNRSFWC
ncbi:hypothetical protein Dsin_032434 [Dipteronia sinensis]|uniref:Carbonic anhydrase n=1 Tax=Dipteronia sinensis TaxID=43782 RepID=A0AAE0DT65_9ROSI|nr:hypothetical protein Dsin_032434 [Dipteronia sinensis]